MGNGLESKVCTQFQEEHVTRITRIEERAKSNTHRIEGVESVIELIHSINTNVEVLAKEMVHQGTSMDTIVKAQIKTQDEVDDIKEKMETKDTVSRLHGRVDDLEKVNGKIAIRAWLFFGGIVITAIVSGLIGYVI